MRGARTSFALALLLLAPAAAAAQGGGELGAPRATSAPEPAPPAPPASTPPLDGAPATPVPPPSGSEAAPAPAEEDPSAVFGSVAFGRVDAATVRVFAVRSVGVSRVRGRSGPRVLALPEAGHGTGVVIDARGILLTAAHVVEGAQEVAVRLPGDGGVHAAEVVYVDEDLDFALLLCRAPFDQVLPLPETPPLLPVRATVDAVGYPLDPNRSQPQSSRGIVAGAFDDGRLQLAMSVNPGNSGGPLIDEDENLVGIVVARGNPERGVQGIAVAVPVGPMRGALERKVGDGSFLAAYRSLGQEPARRSLTAEAVDAVVRFGGLEVLQEAANVVDRSLPASTLARFRRLAEGLQDPDVMAIMSAVFWNAALVVLERAGAYETPEDLPAGPARELARVLWGDAFDLAVRGLAADPGLAERSPFIAYLTGEDAARRGRPSERTGRSQGPGAAPPGTWRPRRRLPTFSLGFASATGPGGTSNFSRGLSPAGTGLTASFAFAGRTAGEPTSLVRFGMLSGVSIDWHGRLGRNGEEPAVRRESFVLVGTDLGAALRFGREHAVGVIAAWSPAILCIGGCSGDGALFRTPLLSFRFSIGYAYKHLRVGLQMRYLREDFGPDGQLRYVPIGLVAGTFF
ncbi:MAG: S1C family serine protease [Myxococcota bacterium]